VDGVGEEGGGEGGVSDDEWEADGSDYETLPVKGGVERGGMGREGGRGATAVAVSSTNVGPVRTFPAPTHTHLPTHTHKRTPGALHSAVSKQPYNSAKEPYISAKEPPSQIHSAAATVAAAAADAANRSLFRTHHSNPPPFLSTSAAPQRTLTHTHTPTHAPPPAQSRHAIFLKRDKPVSKRKFVTSSIMAARGPQGSQQIQRGGGRNSSIVDTLQHTATHCNTLQHTATHCNTVGSELLYRWARWVLEYIYVYT